MTPEEFFTQFHALKPVIHLDSTMIRVKDRGIMVCPIAFVCNRLHKTNYTSEMYQAGTKIGLDREAIYYIASAADRKAPENSKYRRLMLGDN